MVKKLFFCLLASVMLLGCGKQSKENADYVSVKLDNSNMWSLLDVDNGKLIFSDEFFAPATNVVNGAFFVQNDDGTFDLYTLENTKNKLNRDSYTFVTNFNPGGYAIVRVKTEPWQIVDTKGQVIATLDKNLGVSSGFGPDGLAMIYNKDHQFGYIDTQGQTVIKPRYLSASPFSDGVAIVITRREEGKDFFEAIDKTGTTLFKGNSGQYQDLTPFENGYCFAIEGDHVVLLDKTGKKVTSVNEGTSLQNLSVNNDKFIYFDKEFYGLKDLSGKILIRAKYPMLQFLGDGNLMAINSNGKVGVVDTKDEILVPFEYNELSYLAPDRYLTKSGSVIILINKEGKEVGEHAFAQVINRSESAQLAALVSVLSSTNNSKDYSDDYSNSFDLSNISNIDKWLNSALNGDYGHQLLQSPILRDGLNIFDGKFNYQGIDYGFIVTFMYDTATGVASDPTFEASGYGSKSQLSEITVSNDEKTLVLSGTASGSKASIVADYIGNSEYSGTMVRGAKYGTCVLSLH